ncbi:MAG: putative baseplate assembly protein [Methylocystis sp.]|uniref:putative baseplate assembly protein n=1 Tax=Methylocystis sp. TaxID=1911079 RepID=UPI003DA26D36
MPLSPPHLDDRQYDELYSELRRRITVYNPTWTDHNDSDPGVTLLQLFAYMTESVLFRLNQVPEATQLTFLRQLDIPLRPATPARCLLAFQTSKAAGGVVPPGAVARAGKTPFRVEGAQDCPVWPIEALAVARVRAPAPKTSETGGPGSADDPELFDVAQARLEALKTLLPLADAGADPAYYKPSYLRQGQAGALSCRDTVDQTLWIALLSLSPGVAPAFSGANGASVTFAFDLADPAPQVMEAVSCAQGSGAPGGDLLFEIARYAADKSVSFERLVVESDSTDALSRPGVIRLALPGFATNATVPEVDDVLDGAGDRPPPLLEDDRARVRIWLRLRRRNGVPPDLSLIAANAAQAVQASAAAPEFLGVGTGQPGQRFQLAQAPVIAGDTAMPVMIEVEEGGVWRPWSEIESLDLADENESVFSVDPEAGEIGFGAKGPALGSRVRASGYFYGGGEAGNVPPGAITLIEGASPDVKATNITRGRGGADAETLETGLTRIPGELRRRDRAVTAGDFTELAMLTPGAGLGRAECLPRFYPRKKAWEQPGIVSVMIWPKSLPVDGGPPIPDRATIDLVCRYLSPRRLVTTELYVTPPDYVEIAVSVKVAVEPGYSAVAVTRWVEMILSQFLSPLPPYGPAGEGWPLGRAVNPRELEATALQVQGVDFLEGLSLARRDGKGWLKQDPVVLERQQTVWLSHVVAVGPGAPLPPPGEDAPPPSGPPPVPIPLLRETC